MPRPLLRFAWAAIYLLAACAALQPLFAQEPAQNRNRPAQNKPRTPEEAATEELGRLVAESANNHALLVRNLEGFLKKYPEHPRKTQVYRALVEALLQRQEPTRALEYAERLIALQPDDSSMMLLAVDLLEQIGDDRSILRAVGYSTRVLDRLEKAPPGSAPAGLPQAQWELERKTTQMSVYIIRGRLQLRQHNFEKAAADFAASYAVLPNATSQLRLGEIAELRSEYGSAIQHYLAAFVMPVNYGAAVDRPDVRRKLGNVWRLVHGSEEGLGERMLAAYDELAGDARPSNADAASPGKGDAIHAKLPGGAPFSLVTRKGHVQVMVFCAAWSLPCREALPLVERAASELAPSSAQSAGEKAQVPVSVLWIVSQEEEMGPAVLDLRKSPLVRLISEDLYRAWKVDVIPTVVVLDAGGGVRSRWTGFQPESFTGKLHEAVAAAQKPLN